MRFSIAIIFCVISFSASAQFWKKTQFLEDVQFWKKKKPEPVRFAQLPAASGDFSISLSDSVIAMPGVYPVTLKRSVYDIELAEDMVLKEAKHNMRYHVYNEASYNFSDLAELYILQNRFSEAKWYLLQSNEISRQEKDDKHTISNLLGLAAIKLAIGETALAKTDLKEAHDIASLKGFTAVMAAIEKRMLELQSGKSSSTKAELKYAEAAGSVGTSQ